MTWENTKHKGGFPLYVVSIQGQTYIRVYQWNAHSKHQHTHFTRFRISNNPEPEIKTQ